ncbi:T9SS type A sorting domain-containing protein [Brumimicrobium aurantiacum]|nr:T9SS type A sorting domain-containing protein [Brumimicrobium aurantiacum]
MKVLFLTKLLFFSMFLSAQNSTIISKFSWDNDTLDPIISDVGPNASSISASATISPNGHNSTSGLNAGNPKANLEMIIDNNAIFDIDGMVLSVEYQRDESVGTFFTRGGFSFLSANQLNVTFRLTDPSSSSGYIIVNSGNVYNIPDDDVFRNYRFIYDHNIGKAQLFVDGVEQWSYQGTSGQVMNWTGASDIIIGRNMDGTGRNKPFYDEYILKEISTSTLPIELISFTAKYSDINENTIIEWSTKTETNNDYFEIERSQNGKNWELIHKRDGAGNSNSEITYQFTDVHPLNGISYYRLKQTDFDGKNSYSEIRSIERNSGVNFYPNPLKTGTTLFIESKNENTKFKLFSSQGKLIQTLDSGKNQLNLQPGMYFIYGNGIKEKLIIRS